MSPAATLPQRATLLAGLEQAPADPVLLQALAQRCEAEGAWADLHAALQRSLPHLPSGSPLEAMATYYSGKACVELGQHAAAIPLLERSIALQPTFGYSHQLLGRCHRCLSQPQPAMQAFQRATELLPGFCWAWHDLGELLLEQGQALEAIAALKQALQAGGNGLADSDAAVIRTSLERAQQAAYAQHLQQVRQQLFPGVSQLSPVQELELSLAVLQELASQSAA